jgi:hypothetical protein
VRARGRWARLCLLSCWLALRCAHRGRQRVRSFPPPRSVRRAPRGRARGPCTCYSWQRRPHAFVINGAYEVCVVCTVLE